MVMPVCFENNDSEDCETAVHCRSREIRISANDYLSLSRQHIGCKDTDYIGKFKP